MKIKLNLILKISLFLAFLLLFKKYIDWEEVKSLELAFHWNYFILFILTTLLMLTFRGFIWLSLINVDPPKKSSALSKIFTSMMANVILPARAGDFYKVWWSKKTTSEKYSYLFFLLAVEKIIEGAIVLIVLLACIIIIKQQSSIYRYSFLLLFFIIMMTPLICGTKRNRLIKYYNGLGYGVLVRLFSFLSFYFFMNAYNLGLTAFEALHISNIAALGAFLAVFPAGLLTYQMAATYGFSLYGIDNSYGVVLSSFYHFQLLALTVLLGLLSILLFDKESLKNITVIKKKAHEQDNTAKITVGRALLTDAQQRKTLAATRSLGNKNIYVMAAAETRWATALFSRYCNKRFVYPDPEKEPDKFYHWLLDILKRFPCEVLFPMDDKVLEIVVEHKEEIEQYCKVPVPDPQNFNNAADKAMAVTIAAAAGLECPETIIIHHLDELPRMVARLSFPVVVKPRKSSGSRGIVLVTKASDLTSEYMRIHERYPFPIIQEYIPTGEKFDVCLLFDRSSRLKASFVQKEIRHFPVHRGPSTVQESVWRPELVEKAAHLMQKLNWYGVAEVEFMIDPRDGKAKFMEINPRFWGSLQLSILAGVDFPWLLYKLAAEGDVEEVITYETGLKCRWLLPGDMLHFLSNKERSRMDPPLISTPPNGVYDDIISLEDPLPTAGFALACLRYLLDLDMWKFMFKR